jgi:hypothetical protein
MGNTASTNTADISILAEVLSPIRFREITLTLREVKLKYGAQHSLLTVNEFEDSLSNLFASRSSWLFNLFGGSTASVDEVFALSYLLASPETVPIEAKLDAILNLTSYSFFLVGSGCSSSYNVEVHRDDVRYAIEITAVALCKGGKLHAIINEETILSLVDDVFGLDFDKHKKSWAEIRTRITQNQVWSVSCVMTSLEAFPFSIFFSLGNRLLNINLFNAGNRQVSTEIYQYTIHSGCFEVDQAHPRRMRKGFCQCAHPQK